MKLMTKVTDTNLPIHEPTYPPEPFTLAETEGPLSIPEAKPFPVKQKAWWSQVRFEKVALFLISLYLFILAITLMKEGSRTFAPWIQSVAHISSPANAMGFGWIFAYVIMSGSPVAAAALTFFDSGVITKLGAFSMITGSRLGAGFIVLLIGFLYVLRGRNRATSLSMGLLSLAITWSTYIPAYFLGTVMLKTGWLDAIQFQRGALLQSATEVLIKPLTIFLGSLFPNWLVFLLGLAIIYLSFNLFDRCLPQMVIKDSQVGWASRVVYRPLVMFLLGALVTLLSMSVSVSLSILVPLSNRGFIRRENVIPYIMGANITTFIDTLLAAVLLGNPPAFTIVLVEMFTVTVISLLILGFFYSRYQKSILNFISWITDRNRNLALTLAIILLLPVLLLLI
jgi:sodium-dependent phosphate cotransporter